MGGFGVFPVIFDLAFTPLQGIGGVYGLGGVLIHMQARECQVRLSELASRSDRVGSRC